MYVSKLRFIKLNAAFKSYLYEAKQTFYSNITALQNVRIRSFRKIVKILFSDDYHQKKMHTQNILQSYLKHTYHHNEIKHLASLNL